MDSNVALARPLARPAAPGLGAMTVWYVVALAGFRPVMRLGEWLGMPTPWAMGAAAVVALGACVLSHRGYTRAKRELAGNADLAGAWYVENAWWLLLVLPLAVALLVVAAIAVAVVL